MGDNTGSYFRDDIDAQRVRAILLDPFRFDLAGSLAGGRFGRAEAEAPRAGRARTQRRSGGSGWVCSRGECAQVEW